MSTYQLRQCGHWNRPPEGFIKLNINGTVFFDQNKVGVGLILRNEKGKTLLAASLPEEGIKSPKEVELIATLRGLQLCVGMGVQKLILESDCLFMLKECLSVNTPISEISSVVTDIKDLQSRYEDCQLQHVLWEKNKPLHLLARHAWNLDRMTLWDSIPDFVCQAVEFDVQM